MKGPAFQDLYPEEWSHCFGCGRLNKNGHHIRSFWDGDETICNIQPDLSQIALPGYAYGGYLASLIDCHSTGSAAAALHRAEGQTENSVPYPRCVTASLKIDYSKPTPLGPTIELRSKIQSLQGKRVIILTSLSVEGQQRVHAEAVLIRVSPEAFAPR